MTPEVRLNPTRIMVVGDTHSLLPVWTSKVIPAARHHGVKVIVSAGDLETTDGGDLNYIDQLSQVLREAGLDLVYVDGNHDRQNFLRYLMAGRFDRFCPVRDNIFYAPRGLGWSWQGVRLLAAGGAYSIDREGQMRRGIYEPLEVISKSDIARAQRSGLAQIVIAHDCPAEVDLAAEHAGRRPWTRDNSPETDKNRARLSRIVDNAQATTVIHGHYHLDYATSIARSGSSKQLQVIGLGANGETGSLRLVLLQAGSYTVWRVD